MSDTTPIPPASEREREAFEDAYQADPSDPSMAEDLRHFLVGYRAALSHPSTAQGWQCPKCGIERHGPLIACMQDGCPPPPEQGGKG